ncbi:MAG: ABC transporter ATP-binding protein [Acidimicrobiia bacterium]|nr:ABC transporter ATP-binding protein [Acidimicrobiia bacterium]
MTITLDSLTKRYDELVAVDALTLRVEPGETYALLGPNGAGKTTTVEIMEGIRTPDVGTVTVLGLHPTKDRSELQQRVGVMLQEGGIYPGARTAEVVRLFRSFYRGARPVAELLELVGLSGRADALYRNLSGGEKQRLSLALALVGNPEVVFLDEPTAGMDPAARRATWLILENLKATGVTMLLTTHFMDEAERLADRVGILHHGRLAAEGSPDELIGSTGLVRLRTTRPVDIIRIESIFGTPVETDGDAYLIQAADPLPGQFAALTEWLAGENNLIQELRVGSGGLEEVFLGLTKDSADG